MRKGKKLMPVIKADAYGHGVLPASDILTELGIDWAAISTLEEGRLVRDHGYEGNIVSLLSFTLSPEDVRLAHEKRIIPVVHDWTGLKAVQTALAAEDIEHFDIAIKVDTGMCRLGFSVDEMEEMAAFLAAHTCLNPALILSHLAVADEPERDEFTELQAERFFSAVEILQIGRAHV